MAVVEYTHRIRRLSRKLLNQINEIVSFNNGDRMELLNFKPLAKWFFRELNRSEKEKCTEEEFILSLRYIRDFHKHLYDRLDIPPRWDGQAHLEHPHLFIDGDYADVIALRDIRNPVKINGATYGPYERGDIFTIPSSFAINLTNWGYVELVDH